MHLCIYFCNALRNKNSESTKEYLSIRVQIARKIKNEFRATSHCCFFYGALVERGSILRGQFRRDSAAPAASSINTTSSRPRRSREEATNPSRYQTRVKSNRQGRAIKARGDSFFPFNYALPALRHRDSFPLRSRVKGRSFRRGQRTPWGREGERAHN